MKTIKDYQIIISTLLICITVIGYSFIPKYRLMQLSKGRYYQVNELTGNVIKICYSEEEYCVKWHGPTLDSKEDFMMFI